MVLRLDIVVRVITKQMQSQLGKGKGAMTAFGKSALFAAGALTTLAAVKVARFIEDSAAAFATFDNEIRRATAVTVNDLTPGNKELMETYKELGDLAKELGKTTVFTATEAAQGLFFLGQAGLSAQEAMEGIRDVLNLAQIGAIGLAESAEIATDIMAGMGLEVSDLARVVDVLTLTFTSSNQSISQLGTAFSKAGPLARLLGIDLEEVAAALAVLANAGIKGTEGGAALRNVFLRLLNPTAGATDTLANLGLTAEAVTSGMLGLEDILIRLADAVKTGELTIAQLAEIFQARATTAVGAFVDNIGDAEKGMGAFENELRNAGGTAEDMTSFINEGVNFAFLQFKANVEDLKIALGAELAPVLKEIVGLFVDNEESIKGFIQVAGQFIVGTLKFLINFFKALGESLSDFFDQQERLGVFKLFNNAFGDMGDLAEENSGLIKALVFVVKAFVAGLVVAMIIIAGATIAIRELWNAFVTLKDGIVSAWKTLTTDNQIIDFFRDLIDFVQLLIEKFDEVENKGQKIVDAFKSAPGTAKEEARGSGVPFIPGFQTGGRFKVRRSGVAQMMLHQGDEGAIANRNAGQTLGQVGGDGGRTVNITNNFHVANPDSKLFRRESERYIRDMRRR